MTSATANCQHCGRIHQQTCPRIKAIEYHENGAVKRLEFHDQATSPAASTISGGPFVGTGTYRVPSSEWKSWQHTCTGENLYNSAQGAN